VLDPTVSITEVFIHVANIAPQHILFIKLSNRPQS